MGETTKGTMPPPQNPDYPARRDKFLAGLEKLQEECEIEVHAMLLPSEAKIEAIIGTKDTKKPSGIMTATGNPAIDAPAHVIPKH